MLKHEPVTSSNIESVGYDADTRELEVKFKGGGTWRYADVDPAEHQQLLTAGSVGSHFHKHIKSQKQGRAC